MFRFFSFLFILKSLPTLPLHSSSSALLNPFNFASSVMSQLVGHGTLGSLSCYMVRALSVVKRCHLVSPRGPLWLFADRDLSVLPISFSLFLFLFPFPFPFPWEFCPAVREIRRTVAWRILDSTLVNERKTINRPQIRIGQRLVLLVSADA